MHQSLKAALSGVFYGLLALALGYLGLMTLADPRLPGPYKAYIVRSGSMEPVIQTGDLIIDDTRFLPVRVEQVVTFRDVENGIITHRIVREEKNGKDENVSYITKGDNNEDEDANPIKAEQILGEWRYRVPLAGYLLIYGRSKFALIILLVLCGAVWVVSEVLLPEDKKLSADQNKNKAQKN